MTIDKAIATISTLVNLYEDKTKGRLVSMPKESALKVLTETSKAKEAIAIGIDNEVGKSWMDVMRILGMYRAAEKLEADARQLVSDGVQCEKGLLHWRE